ncbi:MAG TPA: CHAD domain-containing protein [Blastocatellia bacterium]|nr:CHAD domain-containing protein [Blastocatellia bacterium]
MAKPLKIKKVSRHDRLDQTARRILRTRLKEFYSHWPDPERPVTWEQLHDLRISGKRLRYSAEALREVYPDRLTCLIDLLKHSQELLGEIQDCVTQRAVIEEDLSRLKQREPEHADLAVLEQIIAEHDQLRLTIFSQFRELWRGMALKDFRKSLRTMVTVPRAPKTTKAADPALADQSLMYYFD